MNILIYEDWNHFIPTGYSWAKGLLKNYHKVSHYNQSSIELKNITDTNFDLIFLFDVPVWDEFKYQLDEFKNKSPHTKIIGVGFPHPKYFKFKDFIDGWIMNVYKYESATKIFNDMGYKSYNVSLASHKDLFFNRFDLPKKYDISFVGQLGIHGHGYKKEDKYLYPFLDDDKYNCITYGFKYKNIKRTHILYNEINDIYNLTKVNLNFHYSNQMAMDETDKIDFNGRVFDIALSSNFQLVDHPYISKIFDSFKIIGNETNWKKLADYYIEHDEEAMSIAIKIKEEALKKHTWKHRMNDLINNFIGKL